MKNTFKTFLLTILMLTACIIYVKSQSGSDENVSCEKAMNLIDSHKNDRNFIILDVRTPEEYKLSHLENAVLVDFKGKDFEQEIKKLNKDLIYLVYCKAGGRSAKAVALMKSKGFKNIYHMNEGFVAWEAKGLKCISE